MILKNSVKNWFYHIVLLLVCFPVGVSKAMELPESSKREKEEGEEAITRGTKRLKLGEEPSERAKSLKAMLLNPEFMEFEIEQLVEAAKDGDLQTVKDILNAGVGVDVENQTGSTPLSMAVARGHGAIADFLIDAGANVNKEVPPFGSLLLDALMSKRLDIARRLIEAGADVNKAGEMGMGVRPLHWAALWGDKDMVERLLKAGADVRQTVPGGEDLGRTALTMAAEGGRGSSGEVVDLLIKAGADINHQTEQLGYTPLMYAIQLNSLYKAQDLVRRLLAAGADTTLTDKEGKTALDLAQEKKYRDIVSLLGGESLPIEETAGYESEEEKSPFQIFIAGQTEVKSKLKDKRRKADLLDAVRAEDLSAVKALVEAGVNLNEYGEYDTPLATAAQKGYDSIVDYLLQAGAEVDKANRVGNTPLLIAINENHPSIVNKLIKAGAKVNAGVTPQGYTPLIAAAMGGNDAIVKLLLDNGAEVDAKNVGRNTPLMWATRNGYWSVAKDLLKAGADVNAENKEGVTPFALTLLKGDPDLVTLMINNYGANVNKVVESVSLTPLTVAIQNGRSDLVPILLKSGAHVNWQDSEHGATPLMLAVATKQADIVKQLLAAGADRTIKSKNGKTALDLAQQENLPAIAQLLEEAKMVVD
jgi:ankyrin repeat protein